MQAYDITRNAQGIATGRTEGRIAGERRGVISPERSLC